MKKNPDNDTLEEAAARGRAEARGGVGYTYDNDSGSPRSVAYDKARDARRKELNLGEEIT